MPIRPENRHRYPKDWPAIRNRIVARAGNKCERCGVQNHALGGRSSVDGRFLPVEPRGEKMLRLEWPKPGEDAWCSDGSVREWRRVIRIVLTVAHLNHTPEDCREENLQALCQRCHLAYDHELHQQNAASTRRAGRAVADLFEESKQ